MGIDYYGILQIKRNSSDLDIKKAYRNLALGFHPDRLEDPCTLQVFKLICEAYDVLGNAMHRAVFDQYGEEGLKRGVPSPDGYIQPYHYHGDGMRTYKDFFGTSSPFADLLEYYINPKPMYDLPEGRGFKKKQPAIRHTLCLTLHEIFFGGVKKMKIQRLEYIGPEQGKTEVKEKILSIPIKPGVPPGTEIIMPEEGDQNPTQTPADIIFVVEDRPHEHFIREGNNLITQAEISLEESLLGTTITINSIDHRTIRIPITDIVCPNYEKLVPGEGMPIVDQYSEKGDLIIRFNVIYPKYLPKASKEMMEKAFYMAKIGGGHNQPEMINKMILADKILRVDPDEQLPPF
ncbi:PREDICTED: dnaJ homolog subfamily B member 13 isoform X1 [Nicrophorus vespilloides]|uniref:DnaJ homolog subfamily B member 13 isoform X1 n=2 Tax=Nicrophorus vespilloides TaxID=110193 RepID=A0ABM1MPM0_NICVS|nr:PREDICTED: dnaJ homolog subfamily B member 13 isoform X1 [Nicrophorus vespilloides]